MSYEYNRETKNILLEWLSALEQKDTLDEELINQIKSLIESNEIGEPKKIQKIIEEMGGTR